MAGNKPGKKTIERGFSSRITGSLSAGGLLVGLSVIAAGAGGYLIILAAGKLPSGIYLIFIQFWSFLYLIVGAAAGFQTEVGRSLTASSNNDSFPLKDSGSFARFWNATFLAAVVASISALVLGLALSFTGAVSIAIDLMFPLVVGVSGSIILGSVYVALTALQRWLSMTLLIFIDISLKLVGILSGISFGVGEETLAWIIVTPTFIAVFFVVAIEPRLRNFGFSLQIDKIDLRKNVGKTLIASLGIALFTNGFPLLISIHSTQHSQEWIASFVLVFVLTRAPFVVGLIGIQSYLVLFFSKRRFNLKNDLTKIWFGLLAIGIFFSIFMWIFGDSLFKWFTGTSIKIDSLLLVLLTFSSVPTAFLAAAGAAMLSRGMHNYYAISWIVSAVTSLLLVLFIPEIEIGLITAVVVGPATGILWVFVLIKLNSTRGKRKENTLKDNGYANR